MTEVLGRTYYRRHLAWHGTEPGPPHPTSAGALDTCLLALLADNPTHAYDLLYWSLMRRASARGITRFDFGRSKVGTGAYDYKRFWGFEPVPLRYQYRLIRGRTVPDLNPLNPKYRMMVACWRRLPLPVANTVGPWIARQLG